MSLISAEDGQMDFDIQNLNDRLAGFHLRDATLIEIALCLQNF